MVKKMVLQTMCCCWQVRFFLQRILNIERVKIVAAESTDVRKHPVGSRIGTLSTDLHILTYKPQNLFIFLYCMFHGVNI